MSAKVKLKTQGDDTQRASPNVAGRIGLTAQTVWRRIIREKRNRQLSVWPEHSLIFLVIAAAFIALAGFFDGDLAQLMNEPRHWFFDFLRIVTDAAESQYYLIPALLIMTIISVQDWPERSLSVQKLLVRAYERAAFIFIAIAIPGIFINIVKQFIGRGRPHTFDEFGAYVFSPFEFAHKFQGFPSGHATTAGTLGMIAALYYPKFRWPMLIFAGFLAFARVPANAHYLSDVMTGYLIGTLATLLFARWLASRAIMFTPGRSSTFPRLKK